jgi:hypothetical protein
VGSYNDAHTINHGFLRARDGTITAFDAPGARTGFNEGTVPLGITDLGEIMGEVIDSSDVAHGFILTRNFWNSPLTAQPALALADSAPVPETSTWAMMLLGFIGLGCAGYCKAKRRAV